MTDSIQWHKIAESLDVIAFNEKGIASVSVNEKIICVIKTEDGLQACTDRCPHAGASLSDGFIDKNRNIVCCEHNYKFNLKTGRDAMNEGYFLKLYKIKIEDDGVFVEI